ncbi:MAG: uL15 family ribosomal protein, partial [Candidatus Anstonellaceae archaeon]
MSMSKNKIKDQKHSNNSHTKQNQDIGEIKKKLKYLINRSKRAKKGVNISKLSFFASKIKEDVVFVVPDKVLGAGKILKPLKVCAQSYSKRALEELKKASCTILDFSNLDKILENYKVKIIR